MRVSPKVCPCGKPPMIKRDRVKWVFTVYCPNPECTTPAASKTSKDWAIAAWNEAVSPKSRAIRRPEYLFARG